MAQEVTDGGTPGVALFNGALETGVRAVVVLDAAFPRSFDLARLNCGARPGTVLGRERNGRMHRVAVLAEGFAWNGKSYPSLSKVALAIIGTRWNGPKFFGLRDKSSKGSTG
jgi:hypothetical protein